MFYHAFIMFLIARASFTRMKASGERLICIRRGVAAVVIIHFRGVTLFKATLDGPVIAFEKPSKKQQKKKQTE